jgi:hypothetical protein
LNQSALSSSFMPVISRAAVTGPKLGELGPPSGAASASAWVSFGSNGSSASLPGGSIVRVYGEFALPELSNTRT